ncbi:MAG TPA: serine/threonine protein kinase [Beijerinckiaceae bacterium]|jgi:serine kinase of HPr protein (carbohydrate metabolism regulator)
MKVHATCVVIGEAGVLVRGPSGSGKSSLARELLAAAEGLGRFARLVSDDRTGIEALHGRLVARSVAAIEGRIEVRGVGIVARPFEPAALVRLVVDCGETPGERHPEESEGMAEIEGVRLPRLVHHGESGFAQIVLWRLRDLCDTPTTV